MLVRVTPRGYFLEPTKTILVVYSRNFQREEDHFRGVGVHMVTRSRHLDVFISE